MNVACVLMLQPAQLQLWFSYGPWSSLRFGTSHPGTEKKVAFLLLVPLNDSRSSGV